MQKDICTYSHTFHIDLNSFNNINNLLNYYKIHIKVLTYLNKNKRSSKLPQKLILACFKNKNIQNTIFLSFKNTNILSSYFLKQSSFFKSLKAYVKSYVKNLNIKYKGLIFV